MSGRLWAWLRQPSYPRECAVRLLVPVLFAVAVHRVVWSAIQHGGFAGVADGSAALVFATGMAYGLILGGGYALCAFFFARAARDAVVAAWEFLVWREAGGWSR